MRVVVTGSNGFVGRHLIGGAKGRGFEVVGIAREARDATLSMSRVLADPSALANADLLVHTAAVRHRHGVSATAYRASNVDLVETLVRAAAGRVGRFVFVSSVGVYGFPSELPITERHPYAPVTLYSSTKVEAERLVVRLATELGLPYTILRPTIIYGPGDSNGMLDKLARMVRAGTYRIVGPGKNTLHHTYVTDVVDGILELGCSDKARNDDFILAGPETITLTRLSELVADRLGTQLPRLHIPLRIARGAASVVDGLQTLGAFRTREPPINHEKLDVMTVAIAFDAAKARSVGFAPTVTYADGVARTLGGEESAVGIR